MNVGELKHYSRKAIAAIVILLMIILMLPGRGLYANDKTNIIPSEVTYNEKKDEVSIQFYPKKVDKTKYEVKRIIANNGLVIYDKANSEMIKPYIVKDNGNYDFSIEYVEKVKDSTPDSEKENNAMKRDAKSEKGINEPDKDVANSKTDIAKTKDVEPIHEEASKVPDENKGVDKKIHIIVPVMEIVKTKKIPAETTTKKESEKMSKDESDSSDDYETNNKGISLNNQFVVSSFADVVDQSAYISSKITGNSGILTDYNRNAAYQVTSLTSKKKVNFEKSFNMSGTLGINGPSNYIDGLAFAFHDQKDYKTGNGYSSTMGIYSQANVGIQKPAIVLEVDGYLNDKQPQFGDVYSDGTNCHLAVNFMNGTYVSDGGHSKINSINDLIGTRNFSFKWNHIGYGKGFFDITYGSYHLKSNEIDIKAIFGTTELYYTIGTGGGHAHSTDGMNTSFTYDEFKYTDEKLSLKTTYTVNRGGKDINIKSDANPNIAEFARPGETVKVKNIIANEKMASMDFNQSFKLVESPKWGKTDLPITSAYKYKEGEIDKKIEITNSLNMLDSIGVLLPADGKNYLIEYEIQIPKDVSENQDLSTNANLGTDGMEQVNSSETAKVAGLPTIHEKALLNGKSQNITDKFIRDGMAGHTYDETDDADLSTNPANLELSYIIKDMNGNVKDIASIDNKKASLYQIIYTLKDTRNDVKTEISRYLAIADHTIEDKAQDIAMFFNDLTVSDSAVAKWSGADINKKLKENMDLQIYENKKVIDIVNVKITHSINEGQSGQDDPFPVSYKYKGISLDGEVKIDVDMLGLLSIPKTIDLKRDGGKNVGHVGQTIYLEYTGAMGNKKIKIDANTGFQLKGITNNKKMTIELSNKSGNLNPNPGNETIVKLTQFDGSTTNEKVYLDALETGIEKGRYVGNITFYVSRTN